ncbi:hypothetical protein LJC11_04310 [Bacteroidales bacterium OttesenSCG-928-I21]|nr:hypothetical protein [Bacteroidales bacterium OttesenSCG-928-I21]
MANRKELKKDLNWLTYEVISDCLTYVELNPEQDEKPIADIITKIISEREAAFAKINQATSKMDKKEVKKMYNTTIHNFLDTVHNGLDQLSKLAKK